MKRCLLAIIACLAPLCFADQVTMKNGDRLSGTIEKYDGKDLFVKSEFAGEVKIPWDAVTAMTSTEPVSVVLKDGQVVVGTVTTVQDGGLQVATRDTGTVSTTRDKIEFVRSKAEQAAYDADIDHFRHPRLIDLWTGTLDLGYSLSRGNSDTDNFTLNSTATRATSRDKLSVYYTQIFARSKTNGVRGTTADAKRGGVAYTLDFVPRAFVFGSVDLENDRFQNLDLRFAPAGGLGYHIIKSEATQFDVFGGASLNREFFSSGLDRTSGEIVIGDFFNHKFRNTTVTEKFSFFPNLSYTGNYRINFDLTVVTALRKWFGWQFTASDRYLSNPDDARKKNDVLLATGLRLTFAQK